MATPNHHQSHGAVIKCQFQQHSEFYLVTQKVCRQLILTSVADGKLPSSCAEFTLRNKGLKYHLEHLVLFAVGSGEVTAAISMID